MATVGLPDPFAEIAVNSIRACEAIEYKKEVKSRKVVSTQDVGRLYFSDEEAYTNNVATGRVFSTYDVHLGIQSRLHGQ